MTDGDGSDLTGDQRALRDTLRGFLADQLPSATLREMVDTDAAYSPELHARLADHLIAHHTSAAKRARSGDLRRLIGS